MTFDEQQGSNDDKRTASSKRSRISLESDSEDDALPGTSTMTFHEVLARASSSKKKKKQKNAKKH